MAEQPISQNLVHTPAFLPKYARDADRPYEGDPWQRQVQETQKSFECFTIFLKLDPDERSIAAAGRLYAAKHGLDPNKPSRQFYSWSSKHRWAERAQAYDNYLAAQEIAAHKRQRIKAATRHARQAAEVQEVLMRPLDELRKRIDEQGDDALRFIALMDDESLTKLARTFAADLPLFAKMERDALTSTTDVAPPAIGVLRAKGSIVRRLLADPVTRALAEKAELEVTESVEIEVPLTDEQG